MPRRPHVVLSAAMSLDGYLDDASDSRLVLSGPEDLDQVDELRASCDAILVGARTIRRDNPRLLVRSPARRARRAASGLPPSPARVAVSTAGDLDPAARFFAPGVGDAPGAGDPVPGDRVSGDRVSGDRVAGDRVPGDRVPGDRVAGDRVAGEPAGAGGLAEPGPSLVYVPDPAVAGAQQRLGRAAAVVGAGDPLDLTVVLADLAGRGTARLLVEGGGQILRQFLALGLADELRLAVAPVLVGDPAAPRLWADGLSGPPGRQGSGPARRMVLAGVEACGDTAVLHYLPGGPG